MSLHLAEVSQAVSPGAHAVVLLDQAGWHTSPKLNVPANISLLALPPKSPELNPTENVWQYLRDNWLSNRVFTSGRDIVDHCCDALNRLIDQPLDHHVHRPSRMGLWVIISEGWYKLNAAAGRERPRHRILSDSFDRRSMTLRTVARFIL